MCEGTQMGRRSSLTWQAAVDFWGMFPHAFLIFHTFYFWHTKHNHLIINTYHFHDSFWHADCDYE